MSTRTKLLRENRGRSSAVASLGILVLGGLLFASGSLAGVSDGDDKSLKEAECAGRRSSCSPEEAIYKRTPEAEATDTAARRQVLQCAWRFAAAAYQSSFSDIANSVTPDCSLGIGIRVNQSVVKLWTRSTGSTELVIIGNRGTASLGDALRDSEAVGPAIDHYNPLDLSIAPRLGSVGRGWSERWAIQARFVKAEIDLARERARQNRRNLEIQVAGHSLGAAVATVAGYDIAQYLRALNSRGVSSQNVPYDVIVYSFNAPNMLGRGGFRSGEPGRPRYVDALLRSVERARGEDVSLTLRQFTRNWDPVHAVPFGAKHPVWSPRLGDTTVDAWSATGHRFSADLGYCPHLNVAGTFNSYTNHVRDWRSDLAAATNTQIDCMFRRRTATASQALAAANVQNEVGRLVRSGGRPAMTHFRGSVFAAFQDAVNLPAGGRRILVTNRLGVVPQAGADERWMEPTAIAGSEASHPPAIVGYHGRLVVVWTGMDGRIYLSSSQDGSTNWTAPQQTPFSSNAAPAVVVHDGQLVIAHRSSERNELWLGTTSGSVSTSQPPNWVAERPPAYLGGPAQMGSGPSVASVEVGRHGGQLYIAFTANDPSNILHIVWRSVSIGDGPEYTRYTSWHHGSKPEIQIVGAPSLAWDDREGLMVAFRRMGGGNVVHFGSSGSGPGGLVNRNWSYWSSSAFQSGSSPMLLTNDNRYWMAAGPGSDGSIGLHRANLQGSVTPHVLRAAGGCSRALHVNGFATSRRVNESDLCVRDGRLRQGQMMTPGQTIWSGDFRHALYFTHSGALVLYRVHQDPQIRGVDIELTQLFAGPRCCANLATIDENGRLVMTTSSGDVTWGTTNPPTSSEVFLDINDGRAIIRQADNLRELW